MDDKALKAMFLKDADLGQIPDQLGSDYLPKDVSSKIIEEITQKNIMRKFVQTIPVANRTIQVPRVLFGDTLNVYKIAYGADVTSGTSEQGFTSSSILLQPQLMAAYTIMLEYDMETAGLDLGAYVRRALIQAIARAEENAFLVGVKGSGSGYATLFDGIYTVAASGSKCAVTPVEYDDEDDLVDVIADGIKELGVYGEDRGQLVLIAANTFANKLRKDAKIVQVGDYNPNELGVTRTGNLPKIHGVPVVESSVLETKESGECAILMRTDGGLLGQRGQIIVRNKAYEEKFSNMLIMAEEIDFAWGHLDSSTKAVGMVLIHKATT